MAKQKIDWYVVTAKHRVSGNVMTWKSRSKARAEEIAAMARGAGELIPDSVKVRPPVSVGRQNAVDTNSPFFI